FFAGLLAFSSAKAQPLQIEFEEYDLDNGLHVILHEDHSTPIVTVSVMYHVGSKNEQPDKKGFAHFFEHLMFEGSENIGRHEYSEHVEKVGGALNANTSSDRTYYYEVLPSNHLELGLWLESERMLHAKVDSIGIATQKDVVVEEKKQNYDNRPYGSWLIEMSKRAFKEHPYRWTTIGSAKDVKNATHEDIKKFYDTFYVPNNAVLVIAGDIDTEETKEYVDKYFGEIPEGEYDIPRPDVVEPKLEEEIKDTIYDNIQLPAMFMGYRTPAMGTDDFFAVEMLSSLLSKGQSSRLYKTLVDDKQLAMQISSFPFPYEDPGLNFVMAIPNVGKDLKDLEEVIDEEIAEIQEESVSDREMEKLKNQYKTQIASENATIEGRAQNLASNYTYFNNANLINSKIDNYMGVTKEDIQRVAKEYFRKDNRVILYYLPKSE
ncbi:MAG: M16 family metallopeptidase, partial [Bacteroidales bacterium]